MGGRLVTPEVANLIGRVETYHAPEALGPASIRYFALAVGAAPGRRGRFDLAPPTLICETCQLTGRSTPDANGYLGHSWDIPFPVPCTMVRGGNDYRFGRQVRADDQISTRWELTGIAERQDRSGHPMAVVTTTATYRAADGELLATNTETSLHRPAPSHPVTNTPAPTPAPTPARAESTGARGGIGAGGGQNRQAEPPVGVRLPPLERRLELADLVAYGAATWDWHRLHYDPAFARAAGLTAPIVDGQLLGALLAEQILRAIDTGALPPGRISRLHFRNRAPVPAGSTVVCEADVVAEGADELGITSTVRLGDQVVVAPAGATVTLR